MKGFNYVAAWVDYYKNEEKICVITRSNDDKSSLSVFDPPYYFYVEDPDGKSRSLFGDKVTRVEFKNKNERDAALAYFKTPSNFADIGRCPKLFETDISPLKRVLMDNYYNIDAPKVHYAFIDIEVDYSKKIGFPYPTHPYAPINAVTIFQSWTGKYYTLAVPPSQFTGTVDDIYNEINDLISKKLLRENIFPEVILFKDEMSLVLEMLKLLQNSDIISGWNSEFYDIPYIYERLLLLGGEELLSKLDYETCRLPQKEFINRYGTDEPIIKFYGKSHLDYMRLFQKFTFEGRISYSLGNILEEEVGIGKIPHTETLEELYHNNFANFAAYNFRDVDGIVQLDTKFRFIALANQMAHENTVPFSAVLGTVIYVETGVINHAHNVLNKVVQDKMIKDYHTVEGAIVLDPKIGLHEWIGSVDINSLYPNTIRSLNISPEKIIGQFTEQEEAFLNIKNKTDKRLCCIFESGKQDIKTGSEWKEELIKNKWAISGYGTIFDQSSGNGVFSDLLGFWYKERKRLQAEKKKYTLLLKSETDADKIAEYKHLEEHYDLLQLTKKISMNSAYGSLLNCTFRFGDERMGASVTASGRQITSYMMDTIAFLLTGEHAPLEKTSYLDKKDGKYINSYISPSKVVLYGDTDSAYFETGATNKQDAIDIADAVADGINNSFCAFVKDAFNCQEGFDSFIHCGREIVGSRGLMQAKKKYIIKVVDKDGFAVDKIKSMGSEIKKADTPKIIQKFLKTTIDNILDGKSYSDISKYVNDQRKIILQNNDNMFKLGIAKQVNNLDKYEAEYKNPGTFKSSNGNKLTIPGHARGACNYNAMIDIHDAGAKHIMSGDKVLVYYLSDNELGFTSISFPAELDCFPKWFVDNFKIDKVKTESRMFDSKLEGVMSAAFNREVPTPQSSLNDSLLVY